MTANDIAGELGITGKKFRDFLRETRPPSEHGQRYEFTRSEAIKLKAAYRERHAANAPVVARLRSS